MPLSVFPSGKEQAVLTGKRLVELNLPFKVLVKSTMKRAQETGDLIVKELQQSRELQVKDSELLREGAPIRPEPGVDYWNPEEHVSFPLFFLSFVQVW
jgi:serine/threonine-protein phosphatase PGAM5